MTTQEDLRERIISAIKDLPLFLADGSTSTLGLDEMRNIADAIIAAFPELQAQGAGWKPISECLEAGRYLLLTKHGAFAVDYDPADGTGESYYWQHLGPWCASHFMPIPPAPQGGSGA